MDGSPFLPWIVVLSLHKLKPNNHSHNDSIYIVNPLSPNVNRNLTEIQNLLK